MSIQIFFAAQGGPSGLPNTAATFQMARWGETAVEREESKGKTHVCWLAQRFLSRSAAIPVGVKRAVVHGRAVPDGEVGRESRPDGEVGRD